MGSSYEALMQHFWEETEKTHTDWCGSFLEGGGAQNLNNAKYIFLKTFPRFETW